MSNDLKLSEITKETTIAANDIIYGVINNNSRGITRDNFCLNLGPIVSSGTATATKLVPTGNVTAGNGMYLPATNEVAFSTNGSERARIGSTGRFLIATDTLYQTRIITTVVAPIFQIRDTGNGAFLGYNSTAGSSPLLISTIKSRGASLGNIVSNNDGLLRISACGDDGVNATEAGRIEFSVDGTPGENNMPGRFVVLTNSATGTTPSERLRITSAGNVGIGLTAPNERLEVAGNIHVSGGDRTIFNRSNNSLAFGTNNTERMRMLSDGKIGFGTSSPASRFEFVSSGSVSSTTQTAKIVDTGASGNFATLGIEGGTAGVARIVFGDNSNGVRGRVSYDNDVNALFFHTAFNERLRITSAGNIAIGTTTPVTNIRLHSQLNVNENYTTTRTVGTSPMQLVLRDISDTATHENCYTGLFFGSGSLNSHWQYIAGVRNAGLVFGADASSVPVERMRIQNNGNVGIGLTAPNERLEVAGNIHVSGGNRTIFNRSNNSLAFGTNNTSRMVIADNGNVTINKSTGAPAVLIMERNAVGSTTITCNHFPADAGSTSTTFVTDDPTDGTQSQLQLISRNGAGANSGLLAGTVRVVQRLLVGDFAGADGAKAVLQVNSTTRGFLPPRMTGTQRDAISTPPAGLILYNSTTNKLNIRESSTWNELISSSDGTVSATKLVPTGNVTAGNGMYLPAANTLAFSTNGVERFRFDTQATFDSASAANTFTLKSSSAATRLIFLNDTVTSGIGHRLELSGQSFNLLTDATARITVTNAGNVGIGLTAPNVPLEVAGNIHVSGGNRTIFNRSNNSLAFGTNNTARMTITAAGQVQVPVFSATAESAAIQITPTDLAQQACINFRGISSTASDDGLSIRYVKEATGVIPADVWQLRSGGASPRSLFFSGYDSTAYMAIKTTGAVRFIPRSGEPAGAENGDVYYDSATDKLRVRAGGSWVDLH
jgi:hypothetical protein